MLGGSTREVQGLRRGTLAVVLAWVLAMQVPAQGEEAAKATDSAASAPRLLTFRASAGITEVTSVNRHGAVVGRREREDVGGFSTVSFVRPSAGPVDDAEVPESFTHIELGRISDAGWIAGYATRPLGDPVRSQHALVLHAQTGQRELLPVPDGYRGSCAFDLSADGRRVSGFVEQCLDRGGTQHAWAVHGSRYRKARAGTLLALLVPRYLRWHVGAEP